jgi:hypothetical protein
MRSNASKFASVRASSTVSYRVHDEILVVAPIHVTLPTRIHLNNDIGALKRANEHILVHTYAEAALLPVSTARVIHSTPYSFSIGFLVVFFLFPLLLPPIYLRSVLFHCFIPMSSMLPTYIYIALGYLALCRA